MSAEFPGIGDTVRFGHGEWIVRGRSFGHRGPCAVRLDLRGYNSEFQAVRADMCELVRRAGAAVTPAAAPAAINPEDGDILPTPREHWIRSAEVYERRPAAMKVLLAAGGHNLAATNFVRAGDQAGDRPCDSEAPGAA